MILTILNVLITIPKIAGYVETVCSLITQWYIARMNADTLGKIADAAALQAKAQTDGDRYAAAQAWQIALSRTRIGS